MMTGRLLRLKRNERGAGVVEFALIAPAFFTFIIAIANLGILFFAHSGLKSAVAEGARYASIYPRPTNAQIIDRITERRFGMNPTDITPPTVVDCTSGGRPCVDIEMGYKVRMNFIFFQAFEWSTFDFKERRRVFVYPASISSGSSPAATGPSPPPTGTGTDPVPTDPTPVDPAPVDPAPVDPPPVDPPPADEETCEKKNGKCK